MLRYLFIAILLTTTGIAGWQYTVEIGEAFSGPSPADQKCNDHLPAGNWTGQPQIELNPTTETKNITCSRQIAVVIPAS